MTKRFNDTRPTYENTVELQAEKVSTTKTMLTIDVKTPVKISNQVSQTKAIIFHTEREGEKTEFFKILAITHGQTSMLNSRRRNMAQTQLNSIFFGKSSILQKEHNKED